MNVLDPHQEIGADFLASRERALLADDMGLGKTGQAIAALDRAEARRALVVCPAILRPQWAREIDAFSDRGRSIAVVTDGRADIPDADVAIISYDLATKQKQFGQLRDRRFDVLIADEAHLIKNDDAKRTRRVLGPQCDGEDGLLGCVNAGWFLTGTPMPNNVLDAYPIMRACGKWSGRYQAFQDRYTNGYYNRYGYVVTTQKDMPDFRRRFDSYTLRRTKAQVMPDLPPLRIVPFTIEAAEAPLPGSNLIAGLEGLDEAYRRGLGDCLAREDFGSAEPMSTLRRDVGLMKVLPICQLVDVELQTNPSTKVVIFGIHGFVLKFIRAYLSKWSAKLIFGGTDPNRRQSMIDAFQTDPKVRVMVAQINAAGVGLNLTAATSVWVAEPSWVPADNAQAIMRAHRRGQTRPVLARMVSLAGTVDEGVTAVLAKKTSLIAEAIT